MNNNATKIACWSELGRLPLTLSINRFINKSCNHLLTLPENSLAKQAFLISEALSIVNKKSYHTSIFDMLEKYYIMSTFSNAKRI